MGRETAANGTRSPSARRDEILVIAGRLFARKGLTGATVRDIADEAGILSGSLYHHFGSKDEIIAELLGPYLRRTNARYREVIAVGDDAVATLRRLIALGIVTVAENPDVARIVHTEARAIRENEALSAVQTQRVAGRKLWVGVVRQGMRNGTIRADVNPDVVVRAMFDAVLSSTRWLPPDGRSTPQAVSDQLARLFLGGLCTVVAGAPG
jgi:AcrR family transcriptional regulator